jgi:hypothetical protein
MAHDHFSLERAAGMLNEKENPPEKYEPPYDMLPQDVFEKLADKRWPNISPAELEWMRSVYKEMPFCHTPQT